ncbi:hypothetical protein KDA_48290 [Dictyobacter alpinus]|uniref:Uncharacterized protein n=1 Tax=Dictyobacter alpinus TaxID=2014873 RepID=A0A402BDA9_9CHLR|nr:hypothetical protein KDA_48290 [Dictyobacter alpinus]
MQIISIIRANNHLHLNNCSSQSMQAGACILCAFCFLAFDSPGDGLDEVAL